MCGAKGPADIVLRVKPVAVGDEICVKHPKHGRCEAAGDWRRYKAECTKRKDGCELKPGSRSTAPSDIVTWVAQIVAW